MPLTRRQLLKLAAGGAATAAGATLGLGLANANASDTQVSRFNTELPVPPTLQPVRVDAAGEHYEIEQRPANVSMLPGKHTLAWTYNGIVPGPTIKARRGTPSIVRHVNRLTVPTVVHLHGGRTPADSDGFPTDVVIPVGSSPFDFPVCSTNKITEAASERTYFYPNDQRAATLWYHDHAMETTGRSVYMGMAGFYLIEDDEERALALPQGKYDIPLMIFVREFTGDGELNYRSHGHGGAEGDVVLVNGAAWPRLTVERRRYRFRILNACNATRLDLALLGAGVPFQQIASDGGLLESPVMLERIPLSMGERIEVVIDFSGCPENSSVMLQNSHAAGRLGEIMRFDVAGPPVADESRVPDQLSRIEKPRPEQAVRTRDFTLGARPEFAFSFPPIYWSINGKGFDAGRVDAAPLLGDVEIWRFIYEKTIFPTTAHPPHLHLVHFQILERNGKPALPHESGWKDTFGLVAGEEVRVLVRFDGYRGRYLMHCHNLEHEDHHMMMRFDVI